MATLTPPLCGSRGFLMVSERSCLPRWPWFPAPLSSKVLLRLWASWTPIVVFLLIVVGYSAATESHGIEAGAVAIDLGARDIAQTGGGSPLALGASYGGLVCVALISNIVLVWDAPIPTWVLINRISPALGLVFSVVIFVGIYTSAAPQLWTGVKLSSGGLTS